MGVTTARNERGKIPSQLAARNRFGRFNAESEQKIRRVNVGKNKILEQLKNIWRSFEFDSKKAPDQTYKLIIEKINTVNYGVADVEQFSVVLAEFQDEEEFSVNAGLFISALINTGKDESYTIQTKHLEPIDYIGYLNTKNITVKGDVGKNVAWGMESGNIEVNGNAAHSAGSWMKNGQLTIRGNARECVGDSMKKGDIIIEGDVDSHCGRWMCDGTILVRGNAGYLIGSSMKAGSIIVEGNAHDGVGKIMQGGSITVKGNAGDGVGEGMEGGEIHLLGDYEDISNNFTEGKIYHKEKLVRPSLWQRFVDWIKSK